MKDEISKASIEDSKQIIEISLNSWKDTYKKVFPLDFLNSLDSKKEEAINNCKNSINSFFVYKKNGKVIGFSKIGINRKDYSNEYGEIYEIYVDYSYRNNGVGEKLLKYSLNELKGKYKKCLISTLVQNKANDFYLKNGGKLIGKTKFNLLGKEYDENLYEFNL